MSPTPALLWLSEFGLNPAEVILLGLLPPPPGRGGIPMKELFWERMDWAFEADIDFIRLVRSS